MLSLSRSRDKLHRVSREFYDCTNLQYIKPQLNPRAFPEGFDAQIKLHRPDSSAGFAAYITLESMTEIPKKRGPVAIRVEGGQNIRIDNNTSVGFPLLDATDVENLSASGNKTFAYDEPAAVARKLWHEHFAVKAIIAIFISVVAAGLIYALGWS